MKEMGATEAFIALSKKRRESYEQTLVDHADLYTTLGKRLRDLRIAVGMSQSNLHYAMGVGVKRIQAWEDDRSIPDWFHLQLFMVATETSWLKLTMGVAPLRCQVPGDRAVVAATPAGKPARMPCPGGGQWGTVRGVCKICKQRKGLRFDGKMQAHALPRGGVPEETVKAKRMKKAGPMVEAMVEGEVL